VVVESLEAGFAVVGQLFVVEKFAGNECHVGAHYGDVGVAGTDVSAFDCPSGVDNRLSDLPLQIGGQVVHVVDGDLEQLSTAEIRPVPVWR